MTSLPKRVFSMEILRFQLVRLEFDCKPTNDHSDDLDAYTIQRETRLRTILGASLLFSMIFDPDKIVTEQTVVFL